MIRQLFTALLAAIAFNAFAAVDVNQATQAELETVKGIGPALSGKILAARKEGNFKNWDDVVQRVGGIGDGNAARFSQAGLTVGGSAYSAAAKEAGTVKTKAKASAATQPAMKADTKPAAKAS